MANWKQVGIAAYTGEMLTDLQFLSRAVFLASVVSGFFIRNEFTSLKT